MPANLNLAHDADPMREDHLDVPSLRNRDHVTAGTASLSYPSALMTPVSDEIDAVDLPVTGALPPELTGRYFWSAPASLEAPKLADLPIEYHPQALYSRLPRTFSEAYPRRMSGSDHRYTTEPSQP